MTRFLIPMVGAAIFVGMTVVNRRVGRSFLYPAAALSATWAAVFIVLCFAEAWLYRVPTVALLIYVIGALYFSLGSYFAWQHDDRRAVVGYRWDTPLPVYRSDMYLLSTFLIGLVAAFPLYLHHIETFTSLPLFSPGFFLQVRMGLLEEAATLSRAPIVENLVVLSNISAIVAFAVTDGAKRWRPLLIALVAVALFYNLCTGAKAGSIRLVVECGVIYLLRRRRPPLAFFLIVGAFFLSAFGAITVLRAEAVNGGGMSVWSSVGLVLQTLVNYFVVSVVGFGVYLQHPSWVPPVYNIWLFFERTANYFGHYFNVPVIRGTPVFEGPDAFYNTYTAYFAYYPEYGVVGVALIMLFLGLIGVWSYRKARSGGLLWILLYATLLYGFCTTIVADEVFLTLNFLLKLLLVGLLFLIARRFRIRSADYERPAARTFGKSP